MIIFNMAFSYKIRKCILFYNIPPIDMIPGRQAFHQLNLALLRSGILHIKTVYTHVEMKLKQNSFKQL